jgi:hypothetical protein
LPVPRGPKRSEETPCLKAPLSSGSFFLLKVIVSKDTSF